MKLTSLSFAAALVAGSVLLLPACKDRSTQEKPAPSAAAQDAKPAEPTRERLVARATERWAKIVQADWIQAYDFLSPEQKRATPLAQYLMNKQNHRYENPHVGEVLACDGKDGYVQVSSLWTPQHPKFKEVKLEPGQSLTQAIEMIESWRWAEGDWTYLRAQNPEEFYQEHPELLRAAPKEPARTADTQPAGK